MKNRSSRRAAVLLLILPALLAAGRDARAQHPPERVEISADLAALVRDRWDAIEREASNSPGGEWEGSYRSSDGPTTSTHLAWSPASGFMVWKENCSRPSSARVNYGAAIYTGGTLKLAPELSEKSPSAYLVASDFIPVKWGETHFLIPPDRMVNFAHAVNSTSVNEVESFLIKIEDYKKERKGVPDLPPEYRKYLGMRPITAAISGFGPNVDRWYPKVILDAGRSEGVVRGMKFYLSRPRNIYMRLEVTDVQEHTSTAFVMMATFTDSRDEDVKPKAGWKFTTRAPEDDSMYHP